MALNFGSITNAGALLSRMVSAAPVGLAVVDPQLNYVMANDAFAPFGGAPLSRLIGAPVADGVPRLWPTIEPLLRRAIDEDQASYDCELRVDGLVPRNWRASFFPVHLDGRIAGIGISVVELQAVEDRAEPASGQSEQVEEIQYSLDIDRHHPASPQRVMDLLGIQRAEFAAEDDRFHSNIAWSAPTAPCAGSMRAPNSGSAKAAGRR
jgi:PAS domain-containing protein